MAPSDTAPRRGKPAPGKGSSSRPSGVGGRLTAKVGPLPVYAWALIIVGVGYLAYRHYAGGSGSGSSGLATSGAAGSAGSGALGGAGDTSGAGGGASTGTGEGYGDNGYGQITALLGQQGAALADLQAQIGAGTPYNPTSASDFNSDVNTTPQKAAVGSVGKTVAATNPDLVARLTTAPDHPYATPASAPNFAASATAATTAAASAGKQAPFGGVTSVKKLANGSTLTTYASGRQVQQAPGKSAYVVKA
jgi:hypothetical protein